LPLYLLCDLGRLATAPAVDVAFQVVAQGLLAGVVAIYAFATAIRRLGAPTAAACAALVPASATLIAWAVLGERPSALEGAAMVVVGIGVYLASGLSWRGRRESSERRSDRPAA
jgi:drug/metabolite transporter (DMT)-like permease